MASLGSFLLLATFVVCGYSAVVSVVGARRPEKPGHVFVHVGTVGANLLHGRPRQEAALRTRPARAEGVVIRVEEEVELGMKDPVIWQMLRQEKRLVEPGRMRQMPLDGAGVRHGLQAEILHLDEES